MKLYATITSERATKGQGGNNFINYSLKIGNKENPIEVFTLQAKYENGSVKIGWWYLPGGQIGKTELLFPNELKKGKRQKGEITSCPICKTKYDAIGRCKCCNKDAWS